MNVDLASVELWINCRLVAGVYISICLSLVLWAGCSGLVSLNQPRANLSLVHTDPNCFKLASIFLPSSKITSSTYGFHSSDYMISLGLGVHQIELTLLLLYLLMLVQNELDTLTFVAP